MASDLPILYSFRRCPYAMRARLALYSAKIDHEHREVYLKNKPMEMLEISPKGTVPVLQLEDGTVLEQSFDIIKWAFKTPLLPLDEMQLIIENDTSFKQALDQYKYPDRYPREVESKSREQCEQFLRKLEKLLAPFLTENSLGMVDIAVFPFIRQFAMVDPEWFNAQPYPRLNLWLDRIIFTPLFEKVMQDHLPWSPEDQPSLVVF